MAFLLTFMEVIGKMKMTKIRKAWHKGKIRKKKARARAKKNLNTVTETKPEREANLRKLKSLNLFQKNQC